MLPLDASSHSSRHFLPYSFAYTSCSAFPLTFGIDSASKRNDDFGTSSTFQVVILVGQLLTDSSTVPLIATSTIIKSLYELYQDKKDDAEIQLQLLFTFLRVLSYQDTREELLYR